MRALCCAVAPNHSTDFAKTTRQEVGATITYEVRDELHSPHIFFEAGAANTQTTANNV